MFDWESSTTPAPVSEASVLAKDTFLKADTPADMETVRLIDARHKVGAEITSSLLSMCKNFNRNGDTSSGGGGSAAETVVEEECDVNEREQCFGMTALHWAKLYDAVELESLLRAHGAVDVEDNAGRKPANMSYSAFIANSKKWAAAAGRHDCEIPEIQMPVGPAAFDKAAVNHALSEVSRLMHEGEPIMVRNVIPWLEAVESEEAQVLGGGPTASRRYNSASDFVQDHGSLNVRVATVPYAEKFDVEYDDTTLAEFYQQGILDRLTTLNTVWDKKASEPYVFKHAPQPCAEGFGMISRFLHRALDLNSKCSLICDPEVGNWGLSSMHFYIGNTNSGAPSHVHSDAANLAVAGSKEWWIVPPNQALFSRNAVPAQSDGGIEPMKCTQRAGDLMYVPFDWGHSAINLEPEVFGYTMELINRRDTFMTVLGKTCRGTPPVVH
eukprot:gene4548-9401_t